MQSSLDAFANPSVLLMRLCHVLSRDSRSSHLPMDPCQPLPQSDHTSVLSGMGCCLCQQFSYFTVLSPPSFCDKQITLLYSTLLYFILYTVTCACCVLSLPIIPSKCFFDCENWRVSTNSSSSLPFVLSYINRKRILPDSSVITDCLIVQLAQWR